MRFLIADDHAVVRRGLREMLAEEFPGAVFAEAANGAEALACVRQQDWDCVVLDISMPGRNGLEALKEIRAEYPKLPVLVLSAHPESQYAFRVLKAGASGYMTKDHAPDELVGAVKKVLAGGKYITAALAEKLAENLQTDTGRPPHELLSDREFQVLGMITDGKALKEIAAELALSEKTVSTYHARLLAKMKMRSDVELARYAIAHGLVED
jgi:two-component system, NarL family, invasion response regulator UvrY